jgi:broad specificity phosphatase PhoE
MLILVRHGQSTGNQQHLLVGRVDLPLTGTGRAQAQSLQSLLAGAVVAYTSPLQRARETAEFAMPHLTPEVDEAFIELSYGTFEERPLAELSPEEWAAMAADHEAPIAPGGESLAEVDRRVTTRLQQLQERHRELWTDPDRHLVVVSHASPVKSAVTWALGVPGAVAWRMRSDNAARSTLTWRLGRPYLLNHNLPVPEGRLGA